jgi:predicted nucleotide-binding protein (sugar kinase/HSP70/actin superfamily)
MTHVANNKDKTPMNAPANTPATTATETSKDESALAKFMKTVDPKAKPNKSDQTAAGKAFKAYQAKRQDLLKQLKDLEKEEGEVSRACLRAFGKQKLTVDGIDYIPTSREDRIYYKEMSGKGIEL